MRFHAIDPLNEIKMSPNSLERLTADIDATVGIEYELVIMSYGDQIKHTPSRVHDYSMDIMITDFDEIKKFFSTAPTVDRLMDVLYDEYVEWISKHAESLFNKNRTRNIQAYLIDQNETLTRGELLVALEDEKTVQDALEWATDLLIEKNIQNKKSQQNWLKSKGLRSASDVYSEYEDVVDWPHYRSREEEAEEALVAKDLEDFTGFKTALKRGIPNTWIVETDSSISTSDPNSLGGIEIISPPESLEKAFSSYNQIVNWCKRRGHQTNSSTGLHVNISLPNYSKESVDFVKLVLLTGDSWVLDQFKRRGNMYAESAVELIKDRAEMLDDSELTKVIYSTMSNLDNFAHKLLNIGFIDKNTSIHPRENRIEFRAPGGDWLNTPPDQIQNTVRRFVVALDAALDPDKYKKEYAKKLYKLIAPSDNQNKSLGYFASYAAGDISLNRLKELLR